MVKLKKLMMVIFMISLFSSFPVFALGDADVYESYTYNYWGDVLPAPQGFVPDGIISGKDMGITSMTEPQDLFVSAEKEIYIADTQNNRILIINSDLTFKEEIKELFKDGSPSPLRKPAGVFVIGKKLYIADTENHRVVIADENRNITAELLRPASDIAFNSIDFLPLKVAADSRGMIYVLCQGIYQGAVMYDETGNFKGYFGANKIEMTFQMTIQAFWKNIMTQEQIEKMERFIPEEFSNLDIDDKGYVYTCTAMSKNLTNQIKKINPTGENIMRPNTLINSRYSNRYGDLENKYFKGEYIQTRFVDIAQTENGYIFGLDYTKGRVFQYTEDSRLITVFGGGGYQEGTLKAPVALDILEDRVLVLDGRKNHIVIYKPTSYVKNIEKAIAYYNEGEYELSLAEWEKVVGKNSNLELAYSGMGKVYFIKGDYKTAIEYFKKSYDKENYAKALKYYRKSLISQYTPVALSVLILLFVSMISLKIARKIRRRRGE